MSGPGGRAAKTRVRTAGRRSHASTLWLARQLNDPYVHEAKRRGYRARSVFKLEEVDKKHRLLRKGARVLDLGCAPGSWTQYAVEKGAFVVGVDLLPVRPVPGAVLLEGDFLDPAVQDRLLAELGGLADLVLSDIAADSTGQRAVDRLRAEAVGEAVLGFAGVALRSGGHCLLKLLKGVEARLLPLARAGFAGHRLLKPAATRAESSELYLLASDRRAAAPPAPEPDGPALALPPSA